MAKGAFKRIKTLRHPNIVSFLDGVEVCTGNPFPSTLNLFSKHVAHIWKYTL